MVQTKIHVSVNMEKIKIGDLKRSKRIYTVCDPGRYRERLVNSGNLTERLSLSLENLTWI